MAINLIKKVTAGTVGVPNGGKLIRININVNTTGTPLSNVPSSGTFGVE